MEHLTKETFRTKVFDFSAGKEWKFAGSLPAIIDFYADWCGPCKIIAPFMERIQAESAGKVDVYKVNTEQEQELSAMFGISSIPSILFIPMEGQPQMAVGALPMEGLRQAIREVLKVDLPDPVTQPPAADETRAPGKPG
jgi:thioredoxin